MKDSYLLEQYKLMDILKVPLIIIVVFIHLIPEAAQAFSLDAYTIISELISHNIGRIAVPSFFLISGYFLFYKTQQEYSRKIYTDNIIKKFMTLMIPYISWNLIYYLLTCLKVFAFRKAGLNVYEYEISTIDTPFCHYIINPLDYPLWYVRDLITINLIAPLIYLGLRYLKVYFIIAIGSIYYLDVMPNLYILSDTALYFVSIGGYFAMYRIDFLSIFNKYKFVFIPLFVIPLIISLIYNISPNIEYLIRFYIPFGVFSIFIAVYCLHKYFLELNDKVKYNNIYIYILRIFIYSFGKIKHSLFFIYAVHTIYLVNWINSFYMKMNITNVLSYFLSGFTLIFICILLHNILLKIMPKTMSILSGGR